MVYDKTEIRDWKVFVYIGSRLLDRETTNDNIM